jgi:hypothetical protein
MPKEYSFFSTFSFAPDQAVKLLKKGSDDMPLLDEDKNLISEKLKSDLQPMVNILLKCKELEPEETKRVINNLIELEAFNKTTINQFIKDSETRKTYSVS